MEEEKDLQDEQIDTVATLEKFKKEYKSLYYVYYIHKYPNSSYLQYLEILMTLYSRESSELERFIRENKDKIPDWVIEKKEEKLWFDGFEFNKKLILEFEKILQFIYNEYDIENGKLTEQERYIKKITDIKEKNQRIDLSAPERLQLLWDLGFNDLPKVKELTEIQYKKLMVTILNFNARDIEGYINSQRENSEESKFIITNKHTQKVKKYLDNL
ncbi:unnamed protein product [Rotaria socialis]